MTGRWPTNVILSPGMAEALDEQTGDLSVNGPGIYKREQCDANEDPSSFQFDKPSGHHRIGYGDRGGASRFFVQAGYEQWELDWIIANGLRPCGMEEA